MEKRGIKNSSSTKKQKTRHFFQFKGDIVIPLPMKKD
jgi:hypothetical protein